MDCFFHSVVFSFNFGEHLQWLWLCSCSVLQKVSASHIQSLSQPPCSIQQGFPANGTSSCYCRLLLLAWGLLCLPVIERKQNRCRKIEHKIARKQLYYVGAKAGVYSLWWGGYQITAGTVKCVFILLKEEKKCWLLWRFDVDFHLKL